MCHKSRYKIVKQFPQYFVDGCVQLSAKISVGLTLNSLHGIRGEWRVLERGELLRVQKESVSVYQWL